MNPPLQETGSVETIGFRRRRERRERAAAFLVGKPLYVGLDLAKSRHAVWLARPDLTPIRRFMVAHSLEGLADLLERAERDRQAADLDRLLVFMEPTSHFWENVANVLEERGIAYRTVSPIAVCRQREIEHITFAKGDYRDAELIVKLGAAGQWLHSRLERDALWRELRTLTYEHEMLLAAETRDRARVRSILELALPELLSCFADPLAKRIRALLRRLGRRAGSEPPTTFAELRERLPDGGCGNIGAKLRALRLRLELPSFGVECALASSLARVAHAVARFELIREQREAVRSRLVALYERTPFAPVLGTIPGVGPESHALLLGLIGDPRQYDRATCLGKFAGIEPRENQSGKFEGKHSISRRGSNRLRFLLHRIALGLQLQNPELHAYIARLTSRERDPLKRRQAMIAAENKYLRLVYRLCVEGKPYDGGKLGPRP